MTQNYALSVRISEEERQTILVLKKRGINQHDIVKAGLKACAKETEETAAE